MSHELHSHWRWLQAPYSRNTIVACYGYLLSIVRECYILYIPFSTEDTNILATGNIPEPSSPIPMRGEQEATIRRELTIYHAVIRTGEHTYHLPSSDIP